MTKEEYKVIKEKLLTELDRITINAKKVSDMGLLSDKQEGYSIGYYDATQRILNLLKDGGN